MLLTGLGIGAYYLVISLAAVDYLMLRRRSVDAPMLRTVGWMISLVGVTSLASLIAPSMSPGPVVGSGGYLGALGAGLLQAHFAMIGSLIIGVSLTLAGLLLCTDYALMRAARFIFTLAFVGVAGGRSWVARRRDARNAVGEEDEETWDDEASDEELEEPRVTIRGKKLAEDEQEEEAEEDETADEWEDDEEAGGELDEDEPGGEATADEVPAVRKLMVRGKVKKTRADRPASVPAVRPRKAPEKSERDQVIDQLNEAAQREDPKNYELPGLDLLIEGDDVCFEAQAKEVRRKAKILEKTFADFGFKVKVVEIETGPVIAQYEVQLEAGLRLSKITGLADDLAIALRVPSVRIVAPIPGKNTVGIEVPNEERQIVRLREVIEETNGRVKKMRIPLFLGKDVSGNPLTVDLSTLPHLLIAGRTGTGKSVCLNAIISSILMTRRPDEVRMLMIDPKMVELSGYGRLPHLMHPVVTDMRKAEAILAWAVEKMEERYTLLARAGVRHISSYNQLGREELIERIRPENEEEEKAIPDHLPFIVIVADEMADLMMTAGKEVEQHIIRLAQKSRAVGIHLILATQKPTVDVITGLIKSNLPARIAFQVASRTDSRVVLDEMGADKLLGNGDMLFLWPGTSSLLRGQGTYLSDDEINAVVESVSTGEQNFVHELVNLKVEDPSDEAPGPLKKRDELYESAVDVVVREGRGSVSLLQRALGIGYGRAARLIDFMAEDGIVGPYAGSQAREVMITMADWEQMQNGAADDTPAETPAAAPKPKRSNKIVPEPEWDDEGDPDAESTDPSDLEQAGDSWEEDDEQPYADQADDEVDTDAEDEFEDDEAVELEEDEYEDDEYEDEEYEEDEFEDEEVEAWEGDEYEDEEDEYQAESA